MNNYIFVLVRSLLSGVHLIDLFLADGVVVGVHFGLVYVGGLHDPVDCVQSPPDDHIACAPGVATVVGCGSRPEGTTLLDVDLSYVGTLALGGDRGVLGLVEHFACSDGLLERALRVGVERGRDVAEFLEFKCVQFVPNFRQLLLSSSGETQVALVPLLPDPPGVSGLAAGNQGDVFQPVSGDDAADNVGVGP